MVESFGCLIIFYIGLKCHFNYFVLYIYIYIYIYIFVQVMQRITLSNLIDFYKPVCNLCG